MRSCLFVLLAALPLSAQLRIVGLEALEAKAKESVEVGLDPDMLKLAGGFLTQGSPQASQAKQLMSGLKSLVVRSFTFEQEGQYRIEDLTQIRDQLRAPGWSRIVSVDENRTGGARELVEIYTRTEQGNISGLAIIAAEPKELTIVAIDGTIDLAALAQLGGQFGIPQLPLPGKDAAKEKGKNQK